MQSVATPNDLLRILRTRPSSAIALCQVDPRATEELEGILSRSFADSCWRLADGRYAGIYVADDARVNAETLRREVDEHLFDAGLHPTLSIGLTLPRSDLGPSDLLLRAEQALTTARQAGGNRVELAPRQDTSKTERNRLGRKRP
jgi:GGDEF domain-containing protein